MTTGSSQDIQKRVITQIPKRWFVFGASARNAIIGGLSDLGAWCYNWITYARSQSRLTTAYGIWLDLFSYDYLGSFLPRNGIADDAFRVLIKATILQERVTRKGMTNAITALTGNTPWIFEPWNTFDTGAYSGPKASGSPQYGSMGYGVGQGGYGNMRLPCQTFMKITRGGPSGVPSVGGYGSNAGGYGVGAIEYVGPTTELTGITDPIIYQMVQATKPTGTLCWVAIGAPPLGSVGNGMPKRPAIFNSAINSQNAGAI